MNKKETRQQLIRTLISEMPIHSQKQLQDQLLKNGIDVTQSTLSRDIKELNLIKVNSANPHYEILKITSSRLEGRLRVYMEDALVMLRVVQNQIVLKTLPGLAQSFGSILDGMQFDEIVATICGDDVCLIICEDHEMAQLCYDKLKEYTPPFFFSEK